MSRGLEIRAEILKLARLLGREPDDLEYLGDVPPDDIRVLREQVTDVLFTAHGTTLGRLAAASRLLPVGVVATIGERAFGPVLSARIAGMLEPSRVVEMAARLPVDFLADVAIDIDPRRASDVIAQIPPRQVAEISRELVRREEFVTMGRFVGHLRHEAIAAAVSEIDDRSLLQVAFVLESKTSLKELIGLLPAERLDGLSDAAAGAGLWPEALDLLSHLTDEQCAALADRAAARDDGVLDSLVSAAQAQGMWDAVLPVTRAMSAESRRRFASLRSVQAGEVLETIVRVATERELWTELLPLVEFLPEEATARVAGVIAGLELTDGEIRAVSASVIEFDLWEPVLRIAYHMQSPELSALAAQIIDADSESQAIIPALIDAAERSDLWNAGLRLLSALDEPSQRRVAERVSTLDPARRDALAEHAQAADMLGQLGALSEALASAREAAS